jgi:hypothetical protein
MEVREITNKVLDLAAAGMISYCDLALMALKWMSEEDVAEMCRANGLFIDDE